MAKKINVHCEKCNEKFEGKLTQNLAGFPKTKCPKCKNVTLYPLGKVYKVIYWIIIILAVLNIIGDIVEGDIEGLFSFSIVGILLLAISVYGLLKDRKNKKSK